MRKVLLPPEPGRAESRTGVGADTEALRTGHTLAWATCEPPGCWASPPAPELGKGKASSLSPFRQSVHSSTYTVSGLSLSPAYNQRRDSWNKTSLDLNSSLPAYLNLVDHLLRSESLTQAEQRYLKRAMTEVLKLDQKIKRTLIKQEPLVKEIRQLSTEKAHVEAENKVFLDYLTNKTEEYRRQPETLWNSYIEKAEEIERRKKESSVKYAKQTAVLKEELLKKEAALHSLKQQLEAMGSLSLLKEKQDEEISSLEREQISVAAETQTKMKAAQFSLLQEKALLEKQLQESPETCESETRKKFNRKIQALELAAKQYTMEFFRDTQRKSLQLQSRLLQLTQQCKELEATQNQLKTQRQQLMQEQWYLECLHRGRQRLQSRRVSCAEGQGVSEPTVIPRLCPKSRLNPKKRLK